MLAFYIIAGVVGGGLILISAFGAMGAATSTSGTTWTSTPHTISTSITTFPRPLAQTTISTPDSMPRATS